MNKIRIIVTDTNGEKEQVDIETPQTPEQIIDQAFIVLAQKEYYMIREKDQITIFARDEIRNIQVRTT